MPVTPTYVALGTVILSGASASVTFSSIPATYRDLIIVMTGSTSNTTNPRVQFNGDTGNGSYVYMLGTGSSTGSGANTDAALVGGLANGVQQSMIIQVMDYSATDKHKTILSRSNSTSEPVWAFASRWASTAAVNQVRLLNQAGTNFNSGSTFSLFGIA